MKRTLASSIAVLAVLSLVSVAGGPERLHEDRPGLALGAERSDGRHQPNHRRP